MDINNVEEPTRCNNNNLLIFQSAEHVLQNFAHPAQHVLQNFAHPQGCKTVMWYNAPKLLLVGGLECGSTLCSRPLTDNNLGALYHML